MNLTMYDAVPEGVPFLPNDGVYAGYIDGLYQSYWPIRQAKPGRIVLPITVLGDTRPGWGPRLILDSEPGNPITPGLVPGWIRACLANGYKLEQLGVYADASHWADIETALQVDSVPLPDDGKWVANWNGDPSIPPGFGAHQYTDQGGPDLGGGNFAYDISTVTPAFLGTSPPPPPEGTMSIALGLNHDGRLEAAVHLQDGTVKHAWQNSPGGAWKGEQYDNSGKLTQEAQWYPLGAPGK